ncbi:ubiquinol oxidase subunit II [Buchnera aphidicola]|uniref:Ubiquinol oxidase subunit 2 n=1 Tax=Buchnera aphidicola subsp. Cinara cedri (strain Cc) TaxID=372461 RepID=Q057E8_BUCCC|nr:ubiquinol oxidase subunit II [Buchnera aphidicola]ABJ90751.1 cytochrome o ubiquinol oxidase subunit II [Buchnera aphidicola BCc]
MKKFSKYNIFKLLMIFFVSIIFFFMIYMSKKICVNVSGYISKLEFELMLLVFKIMFIIVFPVLMLVFFIVYYYRHSNTSEKYTPNWKHSYFLEIICWLIPIFIISFLAFLSWNTTHSLEPSKKLKVNINKPITIEVVSLNWRWLFIYPYYKIATINEISFPKNVPVNFKITSNSVMNSFFIPNLGSQIYTMAGMKTELNLIALSNGIYKGISSNYSGNGFSNMKFKVYVQNDLFHFNKWIKKVKSKKKFLSFKKQFLNLSKNSKKYKNEYFSYTDPLLFYKIIKIFNSCHNT